uniref:Uncharacterized protein n=1 Tax=Arundo donax TaxID=35708 RepID=A0A0A9B7L4_ARUDO
MCAAFLFNSILKYLLETIIYPLREYASGSSRKQMYS